MKLVVQNILKIIAFLAVGIIPLVPSAANAQNLIMLLYNPQVQQALAMTDDQMIELDLAAYQVEGLIYEIQSLQSESMRCNTMPNPGDSSICLSNYQTAINVKAGRIQAIEEQTFNQLLTPAQQEELLLLLNSSN